MDHPRLFFGVNMEYTNKSRSPLGIPGVGMVEPSQSADVPEAALDNAIVSAWIRRGMLVSGNKPVKPAENEGVNEDSNIERSGDDDEKDALIAALADQGIHKTRRSSVKTLREALDEAE